MIRWFCNGEAVDEVPIGDRAFQYGDGLFETVAIRDGQPRLWHFHRERLERGCEKLRLLKPDREALRALLDSALHDGQEQVADCTVKIILTAGVSGRGYGRGRQNAGTIYIGLFPIVTVPPAHYVGGVDTLVCATRLAMYSATAGCKTLNRIEQVLARSECVEEGTFEGFTLDEEGRLICGTMSNVFVSSNRQISTPSLERCGVEGVMRRHAIDILERHGETVSVRDINESELLRSDEVFICNSQFGVLPVRRCGEKTWSEHPVTRSVRSLLAETGIKECRV